MKFFSALFLLLIAAFAYVQYDLSKKSKPATESVTSDKTLSGRANQGAGSSNTPNVAGFVSIIKGDAVATTRKKSRSLEPSVQIFTGDTLSTSDGSTEITLDDKTKITLQPETKLRIIDFDYALKNKKNTLTLTLDQGQASIKVGGVGEHSADTHRLQTPIADILPKKADYTVRLCKQSDCRSASDNTPLDKGLYVGVTQGTVLLGETEIKQGQTAFQATARKTPRLLEENINPFLPSTLSTGNSRQ